MLRLKIDVVDIPQSLNCKLPLDNSNRLLYDIFMKQINPIRLYERESRLLGIARALDRQYEYPVDLEIAEKDNWEADEEMITKGYAI